MSITQSEADVSIARLEKFKEALRDLSSSVRSAARRSEITQEAVWVRRKVLENKCLKTYTIGPPPAVGGLVMNNVDLFNSIFDPPYGVPVISEICDMIDRTIAHIRYPEPETGKFSDFTATATTEVRAGYAFVAMAIDDTNGDLVDTLDAIKDACRRCGIVAERIDENQSNDRITDRILKSIDAAEHVIVDLTLERPNVFYEAGYAQGKSKIPIYIARQGTKLHFDLKDYPIIFFSTYKHLKDELEKRLRGIASARA